MQAILNFFLGSVLVRVKSSYPERFFNLCARNGIEFWDMTVTDIGAFTIRMTLPNFRRIRPVARKAMCNVHIVEKRGFPFFLNQFRKRWALVGGCIAFCIVAWIFTGFVWVINIDGFDGLDAVKLREVLAEEGLHAGTYIHSVDLTALKNRVLISMPELAYVSVNFNGSHADVTARPRKTPPEILDENVPCDIIADKDGIICDITVKTGTPEVVRGDTVIRGQLLASGYITGRAGSTVLTHADAEIRARIWHKDAARLQKTYARKTYTGREKNLYTIILLNNRIKLYINSGISYMKCDKIINKTDLEFFGGIKLPLSLERATYREYETQAESFTDETAYSHLSEVLHDALDIPEDAEVRDVDFRTSADENFAYATLMVECVEKIGVKSEIPKSR